MMEEMNAMPQEPSQAGYCIEIHVLPDGSFRVFSETLDTEEEMAEQGKGQQYNSIGEAMKAALDLFKAGGETEDEDMMEGYGAAEPAAGPSTMPVGGYENE